MNKKALSLQTLIVFILIALVLVLVGLIFFSPGEGLYEKVTNGIYSLLGFLPAEEDRVPSPEIKTSEQVNTEFDALVNLLRENKDKAGPCFLRYGELSDLGESRIEFTLSGDKLEARLFEGNQMAKLQEITGLKPCVVAGESGGRQIPENFYDNFCEGGVSRTRTPDFSEVALIILVEGDNIIHSLYGDEEFDLEDGGFLYKPDANHVCFFPTRDGNYGCDGDSKYTMDDDCFEDADECLLKQLSDGKITLCS